MCVKTRATWRAVQRRGEVEVPTPPSDVDLYTYCNVSGGPTAAALSGVEVSPGVDTLHALGGATGVSGSANAVVSQAVPRVEITPPMNSLMALGAPGEYSEIKKCRRSIRRAPGHGDAGWP